MDKTLHSLTVPKGMLTRSTTFDERKPRKVTSETFLRMRKAQVIGLIKVKALVISC